MIYLGMSDVLRKIKQTERDAAKKLADAGALVAASELAHLVWTPNESDFAAEVANLVPRISELHECRVTWMPSNSIERVGAAWILSG